MGTNQAADVQGRKLNFAGHNRQLDPERAWPVHIIGLGNVGSQFALLAAKSGCTQITGQDHDFVASHNNPGSVFDLGDIGKPKTVATAARVKAATGIDMVTIDRKYEGEPLSGAVICCVDDMDTRCMLWPKVLESRALIPRFIDTRIHQQFVAVYCIEPDTADEARYEQRLYPTSKALRQMCGEGSPATVTMTAATIAMTFLTRAWRGRTTRWQCKLLVESLEMVA